MILSLDRLETARLLLSRLQQFGVRSWLAGEKFRVDGKALEPFHHAEVREYRQELAELLLEETRPAPPVSTLRMEPTSAYWQGGGWKFPTTPAEYEAMLAERRRALSEEGVRGSKRITYPGEIMPGLSLPRSWNALPARRRRQSE